MELQRSSEEDRENAALRQQTEQRTLSMLQARRTSVCSSTMHAIPILACMSSIDRAVSWLCRVYRSSCLCLQALSESVDTIVQVSQDGISVSGAAGAAKVWSGLATLHEQTPHLKVPPLLSTSSMYPHMPSQMMRLSYDSFLDSACIRTMALPSLCLLSPRKVSAAALSFYLWQRLWRSVSWRASFFPSYKRATGRLCSRAVTLMAAPHSSGRTALMQARAALRMHC